MKVLRQAALNAACQAGQAVADWLARFGRAAASLKRRGIRYTLPIALPVLGGFVAFTGVHNFRWAQLR